MPGSQSPDFKPFVERRWTSPDGLHLFARDYAAGSGVARGQELARVE